MNNQVASSKILFTLVVLCSISVYLANCETPKNLFKPNFKPNFGSYERPDDYINDLYDSGEYDSNELPTNTDYVTKLKLLELFLNEMNRKDNSFVVAQKRSLSRSIKDDRRRPGWELAYGKRKRSSY